MPDAASWYLVVQLLSSTMPSYGLMRGTDPLIGPITEEQCEKTKAALGSFPEVVTARCRKAIGMMSKTDGPIGYAVPVFEGDTVQISR